jgi:hypothetical protein
MANHWLNSASLALLGQPNFTTSGVPHRVLIISTLPQFRLMLDAVPADA